LGSADPDESAQGENTGHISEALTGVSVEYFWGQGYPPQALMDYSGGYCFLTGVTGHFAGGGENAYVSVIGTQWVLTGTSQQQGVGAWARCITWSALNNNRGWGIRWDIWASATNTNNYFDIGQNEFCSVAGIGGLYGIPADYGELTHRYVGGDWDWTMHVASLFAGSTPTILWGQCASLNATYPPIGITATQSWAQGQGPVYVASATNNVCMLTSIGGHFAGSGEKVRLVIDGYNNWVLYGTSQQAGVGATATCFAYPVL
jgi:hypothetical protein